MESEQDSHMNDVLTFSFKLKLNVGSFDTTGVRWWISLIIGKKEFTVTSTEQVFQ